MRKRPVHGTLLTHEELQDPSLTTHHRPAAMALGMSYSTARLRLTRMVMFDLIQRLGMDLCFHCEERILSPPDMSIEHKEPWSGVENKRDVSLFWDLTNIAFSHIKCNITAHHKIGPAGTSWCAACKQFLPKFMFCKNRSGRNGVSYHCKACRKVTRKDKRVSVHDPSLTPEQRSALREKNNKYYRAKLDRKRAAKAS